MVFDAPEYSWVTAGGPAFGAPGMPPRWTSSEKQAVGTAYSASSRVWYTISHGILNEIYYPTIDRPQVRDHGFSDQRWRDIFPRRKARSGPQLRILDHEALGCSHDTPVIRRGGTRLSKKSSPIRISRPCWSTCAWKATPIF